MALSDCLQAAIVSYRDELELIELNFQMGMFDAVSSAQQMAALGRSFADHIEGHGNQCLVVHNMAIPDPPPNGINYHLQMQQLNRDNFEGIFIIRIRDAHILARGGQLVMTAPQALAIRDIMTTPLMYAHNKILGIDHLVFHGVRVRNEKISGRIGAANIRSWNLHSSMVVVVQNQRFGFGELAQFEEDLEALFDAEEAADP